jgi:hypothetical protein
MNTLKLAFAIVLAILFFVVVSTISMWHTHEQFVLGIGMTCLFGGTSILLFLSALRKK